MKIHKSLVGKRVCLSWRDPCTFQAEGPHEIGVVPTRESLPLWEECGWIASVNEGLVKLVHARCRNGTPEETGTVVFEDLIETLDIWPEPMEVQP